MKKIMKILGMFFILLSPVIIILGVIVNGRLHNYGWLAYDIGLGLWLMVFGCYLRRDRQSS